MPIEQVHNPSPSSGLGLLHSRIVAGGGGAGVEDGGGGARLMPVGTTVGQAVPPVGVYVPIV